MVRKFVFVPGDEPRVSPRGGAQASSAAMSLVRPMRTRTGGFGPVRERGERPSRSAASWILLALALAISALAFSAAKDLGDRRAGQAAADR